VGSTQTSQHSACSTVSTSDLLANLWQTAPRRAPSMRQAGCWTRPDLGCWCGAPAGIEPATPSLPWNHQEPLCAPSFPQVTLDRKGRSYRFPFGSVMRSVSITEIHSLSPRWLTSPCAGTSLASGAPAATPCRRPPPARPAECASSHTAGGAIPVVCATSSGSFAGWRTGSGPAPVAWPARRGHSTMTNPAATSATNAAALIVVATPLVNASRAASVTRSRTSGDRLDRMRWASLESTSASRRVVICWSERPAARA
jgi:hypothetical protein